MITLRFIPHKIQLDSYNVKISLEENGKQKSSASTQFNFKNNPQLQENLRWYFEDYLQYHFDLAPKIAERIETEMKNIGFYLFRSVFWANKNTKNLWKIISNVLNDVRVEIALQWPDTEELPWELMFDPETHGFIALKSKSFVNFPIHSVSELQNLEISGPIRVLFITSRPYGTEDIPFRSVSKYLVENIKNRSDIQLDMLRPRTFTQLLKCLHSAKKDGYPYHIVHFDGHGIYADIKAASMGLPEKDFRGYVLFENVNHIGNAEPIDGSRLGKELNAANVHLLILN